MSISQSLNNALSGLTASSRMAEVISSNLANSLTDGYGRRQLNLSSQTVGGVGAGVQIDGVARIVDRSIIADRRLADSSLGRHSTTTNFLKRLESVVGAAGDSNALAGRIADVEQSLVEAASDPSSDVRLNNVASSLNRLTSSLNESTIGIQQLRREADNSIGDQIQILNTSLSQVAQLNSDISLQLNTGHDASGLMDQRQRLIDEISEIVPVRELSRQGNQVALITSGGALLLDGGKIQIDFTASHTVVAEMTLASGGLSGINLNGAPIDVASNDGPLGGGTLGASFELRDKTLTDAQSGLDAVARDLIERFADPATDPTITTGVAGLLTDSGSAFDPLDTIGLAGRISVNIAIDPASGGSLSRLRDGIASSTTGPTGASVQIEAWMSALTEPRVTFLGGADGTAAGHAAKLASNVGGARVASEQNLSFASARWETLRQSELATGVDSDHEMQMLLRVEQAYAANARVVQVIQSLMQRLMEI